MNKVKKALQDIVTPEIKALQVEIKRLDDKIDLFHETFDYKIDSSCNQVISEIKRVDERIDSLDTRPEVAIEVRERLFCLEAQVAEKR